MFDGNVFNQVKIIVSIQIDFMHPKRDKVGAGSGVLAMSGAEDLYVSPKCMCSSRVDDENCVKRIEIRGRVVSEVEDDLPHWEQQESHRIHLTKQRTR